MRDLAKQAETLEAEPSELSTRADAGLVTPQLDAEV